MGCNIVLINRVGFLVQIQMLRQQEQEQGITTRPKRPRALVLGPTRELTDQILRVAKSLSHHARFRSMVANGGANLFQLPL